MNWHDRILNYATLAIFTALFVAVAASLFH